MVHSGNLSVKRISFFNYVTGGIFLSFFFYLSFHYRLASDDFYYLSLLKKYGPWNGMLFQYDQWSGRWAAHFLACLFLKFHLSSLLLPLISFTTLLLLYFALANNLKLLLPLFHPAIRGVDLSSFTLILLACFFFVTYDIGETWFWYIIILTYLWSILAFLILINSIFTVSKYSTNYFLILLTSAFIGGASESFALIFIFALSLTYIYFLRWQKRKKSDKVMMRLLFALLILIISFSFSVFAPGTAIRYSLLPHVSLLGKIFITGKSIVKYFIRFLPDKIGYLLLFSAPWYYLGLVMEKNENSKSRIGLTITNLTMMFLVILFILFIPTTFVMSETGPGRALSIVSLITAVYFALLFYLAGSFLKSGSSILKNGYYMITLATIAMLVYTSLKQFPLVRNFSEAYDERIKNLEKLKTENFTGVAELDNLPSHGFIYWEELSTDTSYFVNKHLKAGMELPFSVKVKL